MQGERRVHSEQIDKNLFMDIDFDPKSLSMKQPLPDNVEPIEALKEKQSWELSESIGNKS